MTWDAYGAKKQCSRETLPKHERSVQNNYCNGIHVTQCSNRFGKFLRHSSSDSIRSTKKNEK